eukprot:5866660-Alexandrium_andersonii.AAC.1
MCGCKGPACWPDWGPKGPTSNKFGGRPRVLLVSGWGIVDVEAPSSEPGKAGGGSEDGKAR